MADKITIDYATPQPPVAVLSGGGKGALSVCGISVACSGVAALIGPDHPYQGGPPFPPIRGVDLSILLSC